MKALLKISVVVCLVTMLQGQVMHAQEWLSMHAYSNTQGEAIIKTNDGAHYVVAGEMPLFDINEYSYFPMLVKYDDDGNELFTKVFNPLNTEWGGWVVNLTEKEDGGFVIVANLSIFGGQTVAFIFTDSNGGFQGYQLLNEIEDGDYERAETVDFLPNGGLLLAGVRNIDGVYQSFVNKLDENFNLVWEKNYGNSTTNVPTAIKNKNDDDGVVVAMRSSSFPYDVTLVKADANGEALWTTELPELGLINDWGFMDNGNVMAVGQTFDGMQTGGLVLVLDEEGVVLNTQVYTQDVEFYSRNFNAVAALGNNVYAVAGFDGYVFEGPVTDAYLARINANGEVLSEMMYAVGPEGNVFTDIVVANDGAIVATGVSGLSDVAGFERLFTLKTGDVIDYIKPLNNYTVSCKVFPNPTNDLLTIKSDGATITYIEVFNSLGQIQSKQKLVPTNKIQLLTNKWINGTYLIKVYTNKGLSCQKIMVLH